MGKGRGVVSAGLGLLFSCVIALAMTDGGIAADYPAKPIRLIVPFPPGGTLDILARSLAPDLTTRLGQQIVIENRPGANGVIGYELVARAPADGYTLLIGGGSGIAVHPALLPKLSYDPVRAFAPVTMLASFPSVLIANPTFQARSVQELIALAKAAPGKLTYGTPGTGNPNHLVGDWRIASNARRKAESFGGHHQSSGRGCTGPPDNGRSWGARPRPRRLGRHSRSGGNA